MFKLIFEARRLVRRAFRGSEEYSCLSGSVATGTATTGSDIDLLVVLRDDVGWGDAITGREAFTRGYVELHRRYRRPPDLEWPGEVLYAKDLGVALCGACFDIDRNTGSVSWSHPSVSYRFWVSMVATGIPLTGHRRFAADAERSAEIIAGHARSAAHPEYVPSVTHRLEVLRAIGVEKEDLLACPRLLRRVLADGPAALRSECVGGPARAQPVLDAHLQRWRRTAMRSWLDGVGEGRPPL